MRPPQNPIFLIKFLITLTFCFTTSLQIILKPYCCLFCVPSNNMFKGGLYLKPQKNLNYRHTILEDTCTNNKVTKKSACAKHHSRLTHAWLTKHINFNFRKPLGVIFMNWIHYVGVEELKCFMLPPFEACPTSAL